MVETLAEMKKLRRGATTEDFNKQTFAEQMITRIRNVKSEIVNAQGTVMTIVYRGYYVVNQIYFF